MQLERPSLVEMEKNVLAQLEKHLTLNMAEEFGAGEIMHMSANRQRVSGAHLVAKLGIFVGHGMWKRVRLSGKLGHVGPAEHTEKLPSRNAHQTSLYQSNGHDRETVTHVRGVRQGLDAFIAAFQLNDAIYICLGFM